MIDYGFHGFGMGFIWLLFLLLIVLVLLFVNGSKKENLSPRDILDKRYAKGEIDEEEYNKKRENLEK